MTVSGWGTTTESGSISPTLKAVTVPHVPDEGKHLFSFISTFFSKPRYFEIKISGQFYFNSHIWPPPVAIFLAFWVWEAFGAS